MLFFFFAPVGFSGTVRKRVVINHPPRSWKDFFKDCIRSFLKGFTLAALFCFLIQYLFILYSFLYLSPFFKVEKIEISEVSEKLKADIIKCVSQNLNNSKNLIQFPAKQVTKYLSVNPRVKIISLKKKFPHQINILSEERKPYAFLISNGEVFVVDHEKTVIEKASSFELKNKDLLFITGNISERIIPGSSIKNKSFGEAYNILDTMQKINPFFYKEISEININQSQELTLYLKKGTEVRFGKDITPIRYARLETFIGHIGSLDNILYVDLRFNKQIPYVVKKSENNS